MAPDDQPPAAEATAPVPSPPRKPPGWVLQSALLGQIRSSVQARGISARALARAIGRPEAEVVGVLDGSRFPSLAVVEALLRSLRLVPVCVSVDEHAGGAHFRDYLPAGEAAAYDRISVDARGVLEDRVRDLTLQRVRLEESRVYGLIEELPYLKALVILSEQLRHLAVALAKVDAAARLFGQGAEDSVTVTYGAGKPQAKT